MWVCFKETLLKKGKEQESVGNVVGKLGGKITSTWTAKTWKRKLVMGEELKRATPTEGNVKNEQT